MKNKLFVITVELRQNAKQEDVESLIAEFGDWVTVMPNVYVLKCNKDMEVIQLRDNIYGKIENDLRIFVGDFNAAAWRINVESSEWLKQNLETDEQESI